VTVDELRAYADSVGWSVELGGAGPVVGGLLRDGTPFVIETWLYDDVSATPDRLEWRAGPPRLDRLLLAMTSESRKDRRWVRRIQLPPPGLASASPDGSDGVILRFERTSVEVELPLPNGSNRVLALAESHEVAQGALASELGAHVGRVVAHATGFVGFSFDAFAGVPFSKVWLETRHATLDVVADLARLGEELYAVLPDERR
jgi:hypothetical protein